MHASAHEKLKFGLLHYRQVVCVGGDGAQAVWEDGSNRNFKVGGGAAAQLTCTHSHSPTPRVMVCWRPFALLAVRPGHRRPAPLLRRCTTALPARFLAPPIPTRQVAAADSSLDVHCQWGRTAEQDVRTRELKEGQPRFEELAAAAAKGASGGGAAERQQVQAQQGGEGTRSGGDSTPVTVTASDSDDVGTLGVAQV